MKNQITYQVIINDNAESQDNVFNTLKEARECARELAGSSPQGTKLDVYKHLYSVTVLNSYTVEAQTVTANSLTEVTPSQSSTDAQESA